MHQASSTAVKRYRWAVVCPMGHHRRPWRCRGGKAFRVGRPEPVGTSLSDTYDLAAFSRYEIALATRCPSFSPTSFLTSGWRQLGWDRTALTNRGEQADVVQMVLDLVHPVPEFGCALD